MSIQKVNPSSMAPVPIVPFQTPVPPRSTALEPFAKQDTLTKLLKKEANEAKEAEKKLPINVENLDMQMDLLANIDVEDPNTYEIITPTTIINYLEFHQGSVDMTILKPNELTIVKPSNIDISKLSIDLSRNTQFNFIALDASMAFLASNGTFPENLVIADNISAKSGNHPILLSLDGNVTQNLDIIHSSDLHPISIPLHIPIGLDEVKLAGKVIEIVNKTQTLQIISPDLVIEPLTQEQTQLYEFGYLQDIQNFITGLVTPQSSFRAEIFGDTPSEEILSMLQNPASYDPVKYASLPIHKRPRIVGGQFQIALHGMLISNEFETVDCSDFNRVSFVGPVGFALRTNIEHLDKSIKSQSNVVYPLSWTVKETVCRMPNVVFSPSNELASQLRHKGKGKGKRDIISFLNSNDLREILGSQPVSIHVIFNLVRLISRYDYNDLDIIACLNVPDHLVLNNYAKYAIGKDELDKPLRFIYQLADVPGQSKLEPKLEPKLERHVNIKIEAGEAADSACRIGKSYDTTDIDGCAVFNSDSLEQPIDLIDPSKGVSGTSIDNFLSRSELLPFIKVQFKMVNGATTEIDGADYILIKQWYNSGEIPYFFYKTEFDKTQKKKYYNLNLEQAQSEYRGLILLIRWPVEKGRLWFTDGGKIFTVSSWLPEIVITFRELRKSIRDSWVGDKNRPITFTEFAIHLNKVIKREHPEGQDQFKKKWPPNE